MKHIIIALILGWVFVSFLGFVGKVLELILSFDWGLGFLVGSVGGLVIGLFIARAILKRRKSCKYIV